MERAREVCQQAEEISIVMAAAVRDCSDVEENDKRQVGEIRGRSGMAITCHHLQTTPKTRLEFEPARKALGCVKGILGMMKQVVTSSRSQVVVATYMMFKANPQSNDPKPSANELAVA